MSPKMQSAMRIVSRHLDAIQREVFRADAGMKLTFIARDPSNPEADFLMSEDDLDQVAEVLIRSSRREDVRAAPGTAPLSPAPQPAQDGALLNQVRAMLWDEHPECCGQPVVGAEYMGDREMVCCGCPEPAMLNDAQIVASLRALLPAGPKEATSQGEVAALVTAVSRAMQDAIEGAEECRGKRSFFGVRPEWDDGYINGVKVMGTVVQTAMHLHFSNSPPAAEPVKDTRKPCTCDGAGRGPGRACVVKAGGRLGELWRCAQGAEPVAAEAGAVVEALQMLHDCVIEQNRRGAHWHEIGRLMSALAAAQAALSAQPQTAGRAALGLTDKIRSALIDYYTALDRREHGGVAASRALARVEAAFGMTWTDRASWAADAQKAPEGGK